MVSRLTKAIIATSHILRHPADNLCWGEWLLNISSSIIGLMFPGFPVLQIIKAASEMMTYFFARNCAAQERPAPIETIGTSTDPMEESSELATSTSPLDGRRSLTLSSSHGRTDKIQEGA
jgi:hypothetical protein